MRTSWFLAGLMILNSLLYAGSIDSLKSVLDNLPQGFSVQKQMDLHQSLGSAYFQDFDYTQALSQYQAGLKLARETSAKVAEFEFLGLIGRTYFWKDDLPTAMQYYQRAEEFDKDPIDISLQITNLSGMAEVYISMGNYNQALEYQIQALELGESAGSELKIAQSYDNIGNIYWRQKNFDRALFYLRKSLPIYKKTQQRINVYQAMAALSAVFTDLQELDSATAYAYNSLKIAQEVGYPYGIAFSTGMVGINKHKQGLTKDAIPLIVESIQLFRKFEVAYEATDFSVQLAEIYLDAQQYAEADSMLAEIHHEAKALQSLHLQREAHRLSARLYELKGEDDQAYISLRKYTQLQDSLLNEQIHQQAVNLEQDYRIRKQSREREQVRQQAKLKLNSFYLIAAGVCLLLLSCIAWLLYSRFREQRKSHELLENQYQEINRRMDELGIANEELRQFADLASQNFRQPLRQLTASIDEWEKSGVTDEQEEIWKKSRLHLRKINHLMEGLSLYSVIGHQDEIMEEVDLSDLVEASTALLPDDLRRQATRISFNDLPAVKGNRRLLIQLFQHLISNAIKFRKELAPEVQISSLRQGAFFHIRVEDNGKGMSLLQQKKAFQLFHRNPAYDKTEGGGVGLAVCRKIVEQHGGTIWIESQEEKGTIINFTLAV